MTRKVLVRPNQLALFHLIYFMATFNQSILSFQSNNEVYLEYDDLNSERGRRMRQYQLTIECVVDDCQKKFQKREHMLRHVFNTHAEADEKTYAKFGDVIFKSYFWWLKISLVLGTSKNLKKS